jgi:hypothetical protein
MFNSKHNTHRHKQHSASEVEYIAFPVLCSQKDALFICSLFNNDVYLGFNIKGRAKTKGVWEQGARENIWTYGGWSNGRMEKVA